MISASELQAGAGDGASSLRGRHASLGPDADGDQTDPEVSWPTDVALRDRACTCVRQHLVVQACLASSGRVTAIPGLLGVHDARCAGC